MLLGNLYFLITALLRYLHTIQFKVYISMVLTIEMVLNISMVLTIEIYTCATIITILKYHHPSKKKLHTH